MLAMSRDPQDIEKLQAPSLPEIKDQLQILAKAIGRKVTFRGRKMGYGPLLNSIVIHYLGLPTEQQIEIAKTGIARYESLLEFDEPTSVHPGTGVGGNEEGVLVSRKVTKRPNTKREGKPA